MRFSATNRRGSALLIVLGMMAFMVISAVAFSAYMRSARLPSSFLRRTVASRLLVKAALAEAIEEIDIAIGNNLHPNVGTEEYNLPRRSTDFVSARSANRNYWQGRIYMGTNDWKQISAEETAATLTLEGLAYIPPSLVNEARWYSRHTPSAQWKQLAYQAGRYAFTAIDVSDYFDINVVRANVARSSARNSKISLDYLFDENILELPLGPASFAANWGAYMDNFCGGGDKIPLVSLADWNLSAYNKLGAEYSPFCQYVKNGGGSFYGAELDEKYRNMTFVTDSWTPPIAGIGTADNSLYDLLDSQNQPFPDIIGKNATGLPVVSYEEIAGRIQNRATVRLDKYMPFATKVALYDYLDADNIPLSLSLPTTERVPMICALQPNMGGTQLKIGDPAIVDEPSNYNPADESMATSRKMKRTISYRLDDNDSFVSPLLSAMVVYPFRSQNSETYSLKGRLAMFFTSAGGTSSMGLRPSNPRPLLRYAENPLLEEVGDPVVQDGVICLPCAPGANFSFSGISDDQMAVKDDLRELKFNDSKLSKLRNLLDQDANLLLKATFEWEQTRDTDPDTGKPTGNWKPDFAEAYPDENLMKVTAFNGLKILSADGSLAIVSRLADRPLIDALKAGVTLKLNVAAWARIVGISGDVSGKTVDMVPACLWDDKLNDSPNIQDIEGEQIRLNFGGTDPDSRPLLRFDTGNSFVFKLDDNCNLDSTAKTGLQTIDLTQKSIMVGDPRFNYAPESWFDAGGKFSKTDWLAMCGCAAGDGDIFMQVSNAGYLQSVYELANLPRLMLKGFANPGNETQDRGDLAKPESFGGTSFAASGSELNRAFMWKTYDPFGRYDASGNRVGTDGVKRTIQDYRGQSVGCWDDGFAALGFVSDGGGFKVNPYSNSTNVFLSVLANTPRDWSQCLSDSADGYDSPLDSSLTWNSTDQLKPEVMQDLAMRFIEDMAEEDEPYENEGGERFKRLENEEPWEQRWRNLGWYVTTDPTKYLRARVDYDPEVVENAGGSPLYNTDKKFLYGFWHDCFAAKQQLFLIFVRSEPAMMGGGAAHQAPPQLGARAVALVWRDPTKTASDNEPHRTRVLFYRHLD